MWQGQIQLLLGGMRGGWGGWGGVGCVTCPWHARSSVGCSDFKFVSILWGHCQTLTLFKAWQFEVLDSPRAKSLKDLN